MNWQEYHFKYFKNYCEAVGTLTCPSVLLIGSLRGKKLPIAEVTECNDTTLYQIIEL